MTRITSKEYDMKYKLDDIEKKKVFDVPEGYFEDLPMKIQKRIESESTSKMAIAWPKWGVALAASLTLIAVFLFVIPSNDVNAEDLLASVTQEELIAYLDEIELEEFEIITALGDNPSVFDFAETEGLDDIDLEDQSIDDMLLDYDLEEELL